MNRWTIRTRIVTLVAATSLIVSAAVAQPNLLGTIDFFGYTGIDIAAVRAALPFREGDPFPPQGATSPEEFRQQIYQRLRQATGYEPTDLSFVCCDARQAWMAYIGLPGQSYQPLPSTPSPTGTVRLPDAAITLHTEAEDAVRRAIMNGQPGEDDSQGFALSQEPEARKAQLAIHDYALQNETLIVSVLTASSAQEHRAAAATLLGYARPSNTQVDALVGASLDPYEGVRNNAVRALGVLATAKPDLAQRIPAEPFVRLLRSGVWVDHNKAALVLTSLTRRRDPQLLAQLRASALDSLLEMGRWRNAGHAGSALVILGRIAGIEEDRLNTLLSEGKVDEILARFRP